MSKLLTNLQIKNQSRFLVVGFPKKNGALREQLSKVLNEKPGTSHDFLMIFAENNEVARERIRGSMKLLSQGGLLWFCYPKKSSMRYRSDITRDTSWNLFEEFDFRPVRQISLDSDWSALRFRHKDSVGT